MDAGDSPDRRGRDRDFELVWTPGTFAGVALTGAVPGPYTIGTLSLHASSGQTNAGYTFYGGTLIMAVNSGQAQINVATDLSAGVFLYFGYYGAVVLQLNSTTNISTTSGATIGFASDAQITGTGPLIFSGSGTATLAGANIYNGGTTLSGGTLDITGAGTLGVTTNALAVSAGILDLGGTTQTQNGGVTLTGGTIQDGSLIGDITSTGGLVNDLGGSATLTNTSGTTTLTGTNTYTGATTINGRRIAPANSANAFSAASATTVNTTGTLDLGGFAQTIDTVGLAGGTIQNGNLTGAVTSTGGAISANLVGSQHADEYTSGTTTLSGTGNTYTGATTINGGELTASAANIFQRSERHNGQHDRHARSGRVRADYQYGQFGRRHDPERQPDGRGDIDRRRDQCQSGRGEHADD